MLHEIADKSNMGDGHGYTPSSQSADRAQKQETDRIPRSIIVTLKDQLNCSAQEIPLSRTAAQATDISSTMISLQKHAQRTQKGILDLLEAKLRSRAINYKQIDKLWLINVVIISGASLTDVKAALEGHSDILSVREEEILTLGGGNGERSSVAFDDYENMVQYLWSVKEVGASQVWAQGYNGSGIIVGQIDTGVDVSHAIIADNYRRDYGWFDPMNHTAQPIWTHEHGTQVIGKAVGRRGIGVAPGAGFITCLGCPSASCTQSALLKCAQWLYCPTDTNGKNPDCSKRPHVINYSVGRPQRSNQDESLFIAIVDCWRSVGIIPVAGIGNEGSRCGTAYFPAVLSTVIGVGNVERFKPNNGSQSPCNRKPVRCYSSSSRGPPLALFNGTTKPDISAPGTDIVLITPDGGYDRHTGSSFASPHVAGVVALMLQKNPSLTFDTIKEILTSTAVPPGSVSRRNEACNGVPETQYPNNCVGYGVVNAPRAIKRVNKQ